jgi:hypothetical protein
MNTKYIHHIQLPSPSLLTFLLPTDTHPHTGPFLPSYHFLSVCIDGSKDFTLGFHTHIYCALIRVPASITNFFSISLLTYYSTAYSTLHYTIFIHRCIAFQYYSFYINLFSCLPSLQLPQIDKLKPSCSLSPLYMYI